MGYVFDGWTGASISNSYPLAGSLQACQVFKVGTSGPNYDHFLSGVGAQLDREGAGTFTGYMFVDIKYAPNGLPSGASLAQGSIITTSALPSPCRMKINRIRVNAGSQYAMVFTYPSGVAGDHQVGFGVDNASTYAGGTAGSSPNGTSWIAVPGDNYRFEAWGDMPGISKGYFKTGTNIGRIAEAQAYDPLRAGFAGSSVAIDIVETDDPNATTIRMAESGGRIVALRKIPNLPLIGSFICPWPPVGQAEGIMYSAGYIYVANSSPNHIYKFSGLSSTIIGSIACPGGAITGIAFDGTNMYTSDSTFLYRHSTITATVLGSVEMTAGTPIQDLGIRNGSIFHSSEAGDFIWITSGLSSTVIGSFVCPFTIASRGITFDGQGNMITCNSKYVTPNITIPLIFRHSGISNVVMREVRQPGNEWGRGLTASSSGLLYIDDGEVVYAFGGFP